MTRQAVVDGDFYPADAGQLRSDIASYSPADSRRRRVLGVLSPHAGYMFSGRVAGRAFARVQIPGTVILINPSHHFDRPAFALWTAGAWQTPLGEVPLHQPLTEALAGVDLITSDGRPHLREHSGEVIVPFLQYYNPDVRLAAICVTISARPDAAKQLGAEIARILSQVGEDDALVVASSDMSHEHGDHALDVVDRNDPLAIREMERLDPDGLWRVVREHEVTMCGVIPAVVMMASVRARGGTKGELVARATSADSPYGRGSYVVGYAGMVFE